MRYSVINTTLQHVQAVGGTDIKEAPSIKIIFAELTEAQVSQLKSQGCHISGVKTIKTQVMPPPPEVAQPLYTPGDVITISKFDTLRNITSPPLYGQGMNVAILGTGIRETHEQINGRVVYRKNFTTDPMEDGFDHDTGVCSIIVAMAPQCNILNLKVIDNSGNGTTENCILAIDDCISMFDSNSPNAPSIINMSLGSPDDGDPNDPFRVACRAAIAKGIWLVAAAGNGGPDPSTIMLPSCEQYVLCIGSASVTSMNNGVYGYTVSGFSSRGPTLEGLTKPDAIFFGENIELASSASDTATIAKSGTSFSTPFCTGMGVLYQQGMLLNIPNWQELAKQYLTNVPPSEYTSNLVTMPQLIDNYLKYVTIRPQSAPIAKTDDIGWGLPFGDLIAQAITTESEPASAFDISDVLPGVMMVGMVGMMMKTVGRTKKAEKIKVG